MNTYLVTLTENRQVVLNADSYMEIDDRFYFYKSFDPTPTQFFKSATVDSITTLSEYELPVLFHQHV